MHSVYTEGLNSGDGVSNDDGFGNGDQFSSVDWSCGDQHGDDGGVCSVEVMGSVILKMVMAVAMVKVMDLAMAMDLVKVMDLVVILRKVYLWKINWFQMTCSSLCTQEQLLQPVHPIVLSWHMP